MRCKWCGAELQKGYIQSRDGVCWDSKPHKIAAFGGLSPDAVRLSGDSEGPFSGSYVVAWKCDSCRKIVIEY